MKKELQDQLFQKYPKIFRQKDLPMQETCMCWGISCDSGWYYLINRLCSFLQWNTDKNNYPQVEATQVKEKLGGLRFYVDYGTRLDDEYEKKWPRPIEYLEGAIVFAESMSYDICEECGKPGKCRDYGWLKTLCDDCFKGDREERMVARIKDREQKADVMAKCLMIDEIRSDEDKKDH